MPLAAALLVAAWAGGGTGRRDGRHRGLAAGAPRRPHARGARRPHRSRPGSPASTCGRSAASSSATRGVLRLRLPPLESLDRLSARTVAISLGVLTAGIVLGLAQLRPRRLRRCRWRSRSRSGCSTRPVCSSAARRACADGAFAVLLARRVRARRRRPPSDPLRLVRARVSSASRIARHPSSCGSAWRSTRTAQRRSPRSLGRRGARPSCSRRATAPSSTSRATTDSDARRARERRAARARGRRRRGARAGALPARRRQSPRCTSSASRQGSTRSCPGEGEILGQVRDAFETGTTGPLLDRALPAGAARRPPRPGRDRDRREPGLRPRRRRRARPAGVRRPRRPRRRCSSAPGR